jgi:nitrite reductase (NADH) large subunit
MRKENLVVIGNGMAGARAVEEILARGGAGQFEITMFGDEPYGNYNRILLSNVLNGSQQASEIYLNPVDWYRENGITLHIGVMADSILRRAKCVLGCDGTIEAYDKLIIATGSRSYIPPITGLTLEDGQNKPGVFVFRTLDDCREIAAYALGRGRAAVIGGGLLGLEAARGLQNFGVAVDVIHRGPYLMGQQLDAPAGAILKSAIEKLGIGVHLL